MREDPDPVRYGMGWKLGLTQNAVGDRPSHRPSAPRNGSPLSSLPGEPCSRPPKPKGKRGGKKRNVDDTQVEVSFLDRAHVSKMGLRNSLGRSVSF